MVDKSLAAAGAASERLVAAIRGASAFDEGLANEYHRTKRALALQFQEMSLRALPRDQFRLDDIKTAVVGEMRSLFGGQVEPKFLEIRRYTTPHPELFALLASRLGEYVPGWRLRLLSGDKLHTERRTRELRDLGLEIDVTPGDEASYRLVRLQPDLRFAAAFQLRENALKAAALSGQVKAHYRALAEATATLPERRTK